MAKKINLCLSCINYEWIPNCDGAKGTRIGERVITCTLYKLKEDNHANK
jgi:hypothetical protein